MGRFDLFRRYAGILATALLLLQTAVASAALIDGARVLLNDGDCCAKGAHPPGMCPLHPKNRARPVAGDSAACKLSCTTPIPGVATLAPALPAPARITLPVPATDAGDFTIAPFAVLDAAPRSLSPPPRS